MPEPAVPSRSETGAEGQPPLRPPPDPSWRDRVELLVDGAPAGLTGGRAAGIAAGLAAAAVVVAGALLWPVLTGRDDPAPASVPRVVAPTTSSTAPDVVVHAAGAVARPGVYRLAPGSRVADLLEAAGGPLDGADLDRLNLAAPLVDGHRVYVPQAGESVPAVVGGTGDGGAEAEPLVDLNTAGTEELETLPGIGPATAEAILEHRRRHGPFRSVDDLLAVRGIGPAKLEALRDRVRV